MQFFCVTIIRLLIWKIPTSRYLESEEIPAYLLDYRTIYIKWFYSLALGGIKLQINKNDLALANKVIEY